MDVGGLRWVVGCPLLIDLDNPSIRLYSVGRSGSDKSGGRAEGGEGHLVDGRKRGLEDLTRALEFLDGLHLVPDRPPAPIASHLHLPALILLSHILLPSPTRVPKKVVTYAIQHPIECHQIRERRGSLHGLRGAQGRHWAL